MVERWTLLARVTHWLLFIGVTLGILTGLPVLDGERFYFLYIISGGEFGRELIHHYLTIVFLGIAAPLTIARAIQGLMREGEESWWPGWEDIRKALKITGRWFGLTKDYPEIGFHHPFEKILILSVHLGIILLGISGIPMVLLNLGYEYKALLLLIHDIGFLLVVIPLAGHFMLAINPINWKTLKAMFTNGKVPLKWAKKHHPGWKVE
jgi:formate dehydrogenase gamma subunit